MGETDGLKSGGGEYGGDFLSGLKLWRSGTGQAHLSPKH